MIVLRRCINSLVFAGLFLLLSGYCFSVWAEETAKSPAVLKQGKRSLAFTMFENSESRDSSIFPLSTNTRRI